jgi:hypothetical protein
MSFAGKWMELEIIKVSEISQTQKDKYHNVLLSHRKNLDFKKEWQELGVSDSLL